MVMDGKKGGDFSSGFSLLNQLALTLQEAGLKLEEAFKKGNPEQVKSMKDFILRIQKKMAEEIK